MQDLYLTKELPKRYRRKRALRSSPLRTSAQIKMTPILLMVYSLNNLARIAQLKVISRTSVMQYRADSKRDLRQIASALGVANVLEGAVRREGNHVRVSTELIDARNDNTIWADSYDRDLTDIFAIQSEVAQTIATKLTATLSPEEKRY